MFKYHKDNHQRYWQWSPHLECLCSTLIYTACYSREGQHFLLCKHLLYIFTRSTSFDITTCSIQALVIVVKYVINWYKLTSHSCYTFPIIPCIQLLAEHTWVAYDYFFFFFFFLALASLLSTQSLFQLLKDLLSAQSDYHWTIYYCTVSWRHNPVTKSCSTFISYK